MEVLSIDKSCYLLHWMEFWIQNSNFAHIWSSGDLGLWSLDLQFSEMLNTALISLFCWQIVPIWYIWMELRFQNCSYDHIWSCCGLNLWSLNLKFSEMLNTAPISLFHWQKFLVMAPISNFCPYLVIWGPLPLTFGPQIFRNA